MKKKWICTVCGYIHEGDTPPEICPVCKQPATKFKEYNPEEKPLFEGEAVVYSTSSVSGFIREIVLKLPEDTDFTFKPGSYVNIDIPRYHIEMKNIEIDEKYHSEWSKLRVWELAVTNKSETKRPYSMANYPDEGLIIKLNVRLATPPFDRMTNRWQEGILPGIASTYLFSLKEGDKVNLSGPYGEFHIQDTDNEMVYIGGGSGMAPLRAHILHLLKTGRTTNRTISYWYGARSKSDIFYENEFIDLKDEFTNFNFSIALSDPHPKDEWEGLRGFIHQVLHDQYLSRHSEPHKVEYYICGPPPMANAAKGMLESLGVPESRIFSDDF